MMTVEQLRQELPVTGEVAYFQTGTYGPTMDSVLREVHDAMRAEAHHGPATPRGRQSHAHKEAKARSALASLLNAGEREVAITTNTSQAMQRVVRSISWRPGDEFVMSSLEHVSVVGLSQVLREERGVTIKTIEADLGDAVFLEGLALALTERTRLVCVSHVASADGRRLPVAEAASIAHERGVPVVVDAAQSVGQVPVDVAGLGCDYLVGSGHKWLLGPMGTGFLFVAADHLASFRPDFVPDYSPWLKLEETLPTITAQSRSEVGTYSHAMVVGLGRAIEIMEDVGIDAIQARAAKLSAILRTEVSRWDRVKVLTPMDPVRSAGITTLMFDGFDDADMERLVGRLYEDHGALVKAQWLTAPPDPEQVAMRISIAAFNNEEEVGRLIDGLREGL